MIHYDIYRYTKKELIKYGTQVFLGFAVIAFLFYQSFFPLVLFPPAFWLYLRRKKKDLCRRRKENLSMKFKDAVLSIGAALKAGYSVENGVKEAYKDLLLLHGKENDMVKELLYINNQLANNKNVEALFADLAKRSGVEDIREFAAVFQIAKRSGGDLNKIIQNTATIISEKIEVKREIKTIISAKQFEQRIMNLVPVFIILYISITSPHFFDSLYNNVTGVIIMSACLAVYALAVVMAQKITSIEV